MNSYSKLILGTLVWTAFSGCGESNFTSGNQKKNAAPAIQQEDPSIDPETKNEIPESKEEAPDCVNEESPVKFMITLDISGSMGPSMSFVHRSVQNIMDELQKIVPQGSDKPLTDVEVGIIAYSDSPDQPHLVSLTKDTALIKAEIEKFLKLNENGGDQPEWGLKALDMALEHMKEKAAGDDVVMVNLAITDNFSHNGGTQGARNFDIAPYKTTFADPAFKHLFLYDATPDATLPMVGDKAPWTSPAAQWQAIRDLWKEANAEATHDGGRGFGFNWEMDFSPTEEPAKGPTEEDGEIIAGLAKGLESALKVCH